MMVSEIKDKGGINLWNWNIRRAQIIVTYECNMNCSFCINYELGKKRKGFVKVGDVEKFLRYLKEVEKLEDAIIVFLGGEPTLMHISDMKKICEMAHKMGYKTETYTNGSKGRALLELDGFIDYLTISNYSKDLVPPNSDYLWDFKKTYITIAKLITKQDFMDFKMFDRYVDAANELPFNYDFSTMQETTPNFLEFQPDWVDKELMPLCEIQDVRGNVVAALYKGRLIKMPHKYLKRKEDICTFKLFPNGNLSTTWKSDKGEIDYKGILKEIDKEIGE